MWDNDCYAWPNDAKAAFNYAASIWESLIHSSVPIEIDACWTSWCHHSWAIVGGGLLRQLYRRPGTRYLVFRGTGQHTLWIRQNGATAEMYISYSRAFDWYYGTDGNTPGDEVDFASVVLHEITHGLGFAGSMTKEGALGYWNWGSWGSPVYPPFTTVSPRKDPAVLAPRSSVMAMTL